MEITKLPQKTQALLLLDAVKRDRTTARRACLLNILWQERFLTRTHLMVRVEAVLGKRCFGGSAWADTFYRDMRIVKRALSAAGYRLAYSRRSKHPGYYLKDQPAIGSNLSAVMDASVSEVDPDQAAVYQSLSLEDRFKLGFSISDTARNVVAFRTRRRNPELSLVEANRLVLQELYKA
jgi:hypothetical protein